MNLNEMVNSKDYQMFIDSRLGNDLFVDDPERAARIYDYSQDGLNGSTIDEEFQDERDYLDTADLDDETKEHLRSEIDHAEQWHINNGTINKVIGD